MVIGLAGLLSEIQTLPMGTACSLAATIRRIFELEDNRSSRTDISFHIIGGARAWPYFYNLTREHLMRELRHARIFTPHGILRHIRDIEPYVEKLGKDLTRRSVLAGHSIGGYAALETLRRYPDRVVKVFACGTPLNRTHLPWTYYTVMKYALGIDLENFPEPLGAIRTISENPDLARRVTYFASRGDFLPYRSLLPEGTESHIFKNPTHVCFLHAEEVCDKMARDILEDMNLFGRKVIPIEEARSQKQAS